MEEIALRNQKMATIVKSYLLNLPIIQQKRIAAIENKKMNKITSKIQRGDIFWMKNKK